jgi:hypothetical protein
MLSASGALKPAWLLGCALGLRKNTLLIRGRNTGAKALIDLGTLRGAEAPLFHGAVCVCEFSQPSEAVRSDALHGWLKITGRWQLATGN